MVPITILTGYLGAGKTTLLRHMLKKTSERIAIVMNEFGEIAIDSAVLKGENIEIAELSGGCVCCSITGEFEEALKEIVGRTKPDRIVLETSGVADPESIVYDIRENVPMAQLDGVVTLVDARELSHFPGLGETVKSQIRLADVILVNKADLVSEGDMQRIERIVRELNRTALMVRTVGASIDPKLLFGYRSERAVSHKPHRADVEHFLISGSALRKDAFERFVKHMPEGIYRAKGFVILDDKGYLFNYVNGRYDLEKFDAKKTELVFIGPGAVSVEKEIRESVRKCMGQ